MQNTKSRSPLTYAHTHTHTHLYIYSKSNDLQRQHFGKIKAKHDRPQVRKI